MSRRRATICGRDLHTACSPRNTCPPLDSRQMFFPCNPSTSVLIDPAFRKTRFNQMLRWNGLPSFSSMICFTRRSTLYLRPAPSLSDQSDCSLDGSNYCQDVGWASWIADSQRFFADAVPDEASTARRTSTRATAKLGDEPYTSARSIDSTKRPPSPDEVRLVARSRAHKEARV